MVPVIIYLPLNSLPNKTLFSKSMHVWTVWASSGLLSHYRKGKRKLHNDSAIWVCVPAELFGVSKTNGEKTLSYLLVTAEQRAEKLRLTFKKMSFPPAP